MPDREGEGDHGDRCGQEPPASGGDGANRPDSNPWITHESKLVYENPWISVVENQVTHGRGGRGIYGVVHFRNRAVGVIALDEEDHVWLVGQYRYPLGQYEWEIPEGGAPEGEELVECARRELLEEAGIRADSVELFLGGLQLSNSVCDEVATVFLARGLSYHEARPEATEQLQVRRVPLEEAFAMVDRGELRDSMTVIGLLKLRVERLLGRV